MTARMTSANGERGSETPRPISALPSVQARILAFAAIVVAGLCGGLIGSSAVKVGCHGSCASPEGVGGLIGAITAAGGVAVIAVLVLRAMGEWRSIKEKRQLEAMIEAVAGTFTEGGTDRADGNLPAIDEAAASEAAASEADADLPATDPVSAPDLDPPPPVAPPDPPPPDIAVAPASEPTIGSAPDVAPVTEVAPAPEPEG